MEVSYVAHTYQQAVLVTPCEKALVYTYSPTMNIRVEGLGLGFRVQGAHPGLPRPLQVDVA